MNIYNVIEVSYDCDERLCHDGDPVINVSSYSSRESAENAVKEIAQSYESPIDEDGEERDEYNTYSIEEIANGVICTSSTAEAIITIEETKLH